jgi:hypothetical protein
MHAQRRRYLIGGHQRLHAAAMVLLARHASTVDLHCASLPIVSCSVAVIASASRAARR